MIQGSNAYELYTGVSYNSNNERGTRLHIHDRRCQIEQSARTPTPRVVEEA